MTKLTRVSMATLVALVIASGPALPQAQTPSAPRITTPRQQFGHDIGDDYRLVNYTQYVEYLQKVDRESDRMTVIDIGPTAEGRREYTAIVTAPANHKQLDRFKEINRRLARAEGLTDDQARTLARDGKAVVWIDGGLHANEVLGAQQLIETLYQLNSKTDAETMRILDDTIVLLTLVNPDGMELVSNWYMREPDEQRRSTGNLPRLYQKYIGHDNNRDFYMMNQPESENANRIMYREWYPAIMYNHHQTGPAGAVLFAPPFRDPFNYQFDPLIPLGIDMVGAAIHTRLAVENKPGAVMGTATSYSTWWNGGLRTMSYFHNQIGILTEMIGNPTPVEIPFVPAMQLPRGDVPNPIAPQTWHFRRSIDYSITNNYAILDLASERKEDILFNMYKMGSNSIERGNRDHWTITPGRIEAVRAAAADAGRGGGGGGRGGTPTALYEKVLRDPANRDPRGYIIPSSQPDFLTATKFVNILIKGGVDVHRATASFNAGGKSYPAGSYVVKGAQAFRPHLRDMFEPQDHPNDFRYPGGPPIPPYDVTGYTPAYSMGVQFERILEGFDGPFEKLPDVVRPTAASVSAPPPGRGYWLMHDVNDSFIAVNRLLKAGERVMWSRATVSDSVRIAGQSSERSFDTFLVAGGASTKSVLDQAASDTGLLVQSGTLIPPNATPVRAARIGLWDQYGGSMPSGWTRWLLEQFEFPFEVVYPQSLDAGNLKQRFDVLIFPTGAIPMRDGGGAGPAPASIPEEYRHTLGRVTVSRTVPALKEFVEAGGTLIAIGSSTSIATHFGLPVRDALVERGADGREVALPQEKFYVPGSILEMRVDRNHPLGYGMPERVMVFFDDSPAFRLLPEASAAGVKAVAWFDSPTPLRSGWAWGQHYLDQTAAIVEAPLGRGRVVLFGPEVAWRAQPHGTFKLLFNALYGTE